MSQRYSQRQDEYADHTVPLATPHAALADVFTVYAGNIPFSAQETELREVFAPFRPLSCDIMRNMHGTSRGYALIKFPDKAAAEAAIAATNGVVFQGRPLQVRGCGVSC